MKTLICIILACLLIFGIAFWIYSRWDAWFANPVEPPYISKEKPSRIMLTFGDSIGESRNVNWQCGALLHPSFLELADLTEKTLQTIPAEGKIYASQGGVTSYYVAKLRGLKAGHRYAYRVCTAGFYSKVYDFTVQNRLESTEFIYVGDIQDSIAGIANQLLRKAFSHHPKAEFLVCGGDLIERPLDCYWTEMFQTLDSIAQHMPILTVTGNHDYWKGITCTLDPRFTLVHSFYQDSQVDDNQVFTTRYGDIQFFALDSNREIWHLWKQRGWLQKQLSASNAKWKIIITHHPLHSIASSTNNLIQQWMFDDLARTYGVDVILQGHEHAYARMRSNQQTIPVYTVSHCSPKNYRIEFDEETFDRYGSGSRYYQKIRTHLDTLFLTAYDAHSGLLYDSLRIIKDNRQLRVTDDALHIPEVIEFCPDSTKRTDLQFAERIRRYKAIKKL